MISALIVLVAVVMVSWYSVRRKKRRVTLSVRRTQRIQRLDALHIDIEYSDTVLDSPTTDRLSAGYTNLCSDISLDQDSQTQNSGNPESSSGHTPSDKHEDTDLTDAEFSTSLNEIKDSDAIATSNSFTEAFNDSITTTKCFSVEQSNDEIKPVPPIRFDFDTSSTNSFEIEMTLAALRNEEMTVNHLRSQDDSPGYLNDNDGAVVCSVCEKDSDKVDGTEMIGDRESLIARRNSTSFDNQGLEVAD